MDDFIDLDKYYPNIMRKRWKNNDLINVITKMATISTVATNGTSTLQWLLKKFADQKKI